MASPITTGASPKSSFSTAPPRWSVPPACAGLDPEMFFPIEEDGPSSADARAVCGGCDLRDRCLQHALATAMPAGIWGGLSTTERDALIRASRRVLRAR